MTRINQKSIIRLHPIQEAIRILNDENVFVIQIEPVGNNIVSFLIEYLNKEEQ